MTRPKPGASPFTHALTEPVEPATEQQKADARAYLARHDADDLAEMLGVEE